MIHLILKYAKSHIYELHALLAGLLAFFILLKGKLPLKKALDRYTAKRAEKSEKWQKRAAVYRRRMGLSIILLDLILSAAIFTVLSFLSPLIRFSKPMLLLSGILSLTIYAVYDQLELPGRRKNHE